MIGIRIKGAFLETVSSTAISFELVSTIFLGDSEGFIPGSYSFPFDLPLSDHNRITLGLPEIIGNAEPLMSKEPCEIYFNNQRLPLDGLASISEVSGGTIKFYITIQPLDPLKKLKLNELDLGGDRDLGAPLSNRLVLAKLTATTPLAYDYAFFPVVNYEFWGPNPTLSVVQNEYDTDTGNFVSGDNNRSAMPFLRLDYLLKQLFETKGLVFTNSFQVTDDLKKLYFYNNYSIYQGDDWGRYVNFQNHVPKMEANDFLRHFIRYFCLALVKEPFDPVFELVTCEELLQQAPAHDWTSRLLANPVIGQSPLKIKELRQKPNGIDKMETELVDDPPSLTILGSTYTLVGSVDSYIDALAQPFGDGFYYIRSLDAYALMPQSNVSLIHRRNRKVIGTDGEVLELDLSIPSTDYRLFYGTPLVRVPGTLPDEDKEKDYRNDFPLILLQYLGIYPLSDIPSSTAPVASATGRTNDGSVVGDYATTLDGADGVYAKLWANWANMLSKGREVTAQLDLSLTDILNFRFRHIVRIQNMNYFVKSLRVNFTQKGLEPVQAKLISIV